MGQTLINLYPLPNYTDPNNRYNYVYNALQQQNTTQMTLRLDYNFSDSTKAYVRIAQDDGQVNQARGLWWNSSNYELPTTINNGQLGRSASFNLTSVLSPTTTNEFIFSYSKLKLDNLHADESKISLSGLGLNGYEGFFGQQTPFAPIQIYSWGQGLGNLWDPADQQNIFAEHLGRSVRMTDDELNHLVDHGSPTPGLDALETLSSAWYRAAAECSPSAPVLLRDIACRIRSARRFLNYAADHYLHRTQPRWAPGF